MEPVIEIKEITERIGILKLHINEKTKLLVIRVYATTAGAEKEDIKNLYDSLEKVLQDEKEYYNILIGDWNAKIGIEEGGSRNVGKYELGVRNERGRDLVEFTEINNLKIAKTFAKQKMKRKWTWISPNYKVRNEIDHILVNDLSII